MDRQERIIEARKHHKTKLQRQQEAIERKEATIARHIRYGTNPREIAFLEKDLELSRRRLPGAF